MPYTVIYMHCFPHEGVKETPDIAPPALGATHLAALATPLARSGVRRRNSMEDDDSPIVKQRSSSAAKKRAMLRRDNMEDELPSPVDSEEENAAAPPAPLSSTAAPAVAPPALAVEAALLVPHAVAISDGLLESIVNAFAEDIVPSHRELHNMLGGAVFNKVREIIPRPPN